MKRITLFTLLCVVVLLTACNSGTSYWIDNPTNEPITVAIDETSYTIPSVSMLEVSVDYGKHQLKYNGQELTFHNGGRTNNTPAIINPTQSTYVFYRQCFMNKSDERATDEFAAWALKTQSDSVTLSINDTITTVFIPFNASNNIFLSKTDFDWKLTLGEPMPEGIQLNNPLVTRHNRSLLNDENYKAGKFQETIYKIYREEEFKEFFKEVSDDKIDFMLTKTPYSALPRTKIKLTTLGEISDPVYVKALEEEVQKVNDWFNLKGGDSASGFKETIFSSKAINALKSKYLEEHPKDFSFSEAARELESQKNYLMRYQLNIID